MTDGNVANYKNVLYLNILQVCFYEKTPEMYFDFDPPSPRVDPWGPQGASNDKVAEIKKC